MKVYYYVPTSDRPSWGAGMIYYHVWLLRKNNIEAFILHETKPFKITWLSLDVPFNYLNDKNLRIEKNDYLVIPEVCADNEQLQKYSCKKIVFVQNAFYIYEGLTRDKSYEELGIEQMFYYMPHLLKILSFITKLPLYETPPFVAPYYFAEKINHQRKKRILLYPKFQNKEYDILKRLLIEKLSIKNKNLFQKFLTTPDWEIVELQNKKHHEVPKEMQQASFFVSINTTEAFNSSVPEAMACGCINICFEGVGPADFLNNTQNAFVFPNDHIYEMAEKIIYLAQHYDELEEELRTIRTNAFDTVNNYKIDSLEKALVNFFVPKNN